MTTQQHILIADDDFEDRSIMAECFKELGHEEMVRYVEDGSRLLEYMEETTPDTVSLIVLDLNMPRLNGTETLRILKGDDRYRHIPVIIFSTSVNEIEKKNCLQLGARDYVTKPTKWANYVNTCRMLYAIAKDE